MHVHGGVWWGVSYRDRCKGVVLRSQRVFVVCYHGHISLHRSCQHKIGHCKLRLLIKSLNYPLEAVTKEMAAKVDTVFTV